MRKTSNGFLKILAMVMFNYTQSIVLEHQIQEQEQTLEHSKQQLKSARAKLERTYSSLTEQIETSEVSLILKLDIL